MLSTESALRTTIMAAEFRKIIGETVIVLCSALTFLFGVAVSAPSSTGHATSVVRSNSDRSDYAIIHTTKVNLAVSQTGQVGCGVPGASFTYFANPTKDYLVDGSLILGNAANNLSWRIYSRTQPPPSPSNPYGLLLPMSDLIVDSTSFPRYTIAKGKGTNRDSTIGFDVTYYAPKHVDTSDFILIQFDLYKGVNNPLGISSGLVVSFAADWNLPSDSGSNNSGGCEEERQMMYQRGETSTLMRQQFGGIAAIRNDPFSIWGGPIWESSKYVYPWQGFQADSVWKYTSQSDTFTCGTPITDLSTVLVIEKSLTINGAVHDTFGFCIVLEGQLDGSLEGLRHEVLGKARSFYCHYTPHWLYVCGECGMCECGDANFDATIDISDAVYLIATIFSGGPLPLDCCYHMARGDANGDKTVDISDAVYLIARIFSGGPMPHCWGY
jgi:hypothetical protein